MEIKTMVAQYREAQTLGFIEDINDPNDCNSECTECPANKSCEFLAETQDFPTFVRNYNNLIVPNLDV